MVKRSLSLNSLLGGLIALAFIGLAYYSPPFMEQAERISYDTVTRLALPETPIDQRILLIEIHQKSLDKLGSWPWPRDLIARRVHLAKGSGAKVIGLNVPLLDEEKNAGLREAKIAGQLSHPSIVTIHDMGEDQDLTFMAMEYKALAKNLDERFQTAGQMAKLLRLFPLKVDQKQKKKMAEKEAAPRS